ncbi:MAG: hypothetical protein HZA53_10075 [Planctomycetes bacterium]|nr:hypothetical protein [Planctomycetota bacterium]
MQTKHLTHSCVLALLALSVASVRAQAQCAASWDDRFGAGTPDALAKACVAWDDGTGEHLYVGGEFTSVGAQPLAFLARWDEGAWSAVGGGVDGWVGAVHVHDFGQGPRLVAAGNFLTAGGVPANHIAVWDGASWSPLGVGLDELVLALETHDDGTGAKLYAGGTFTTSGGAPVARLASWNGTSWSSVGGGVNAPVHALESADLGTGTALFAGGEFTNAGGTAVNYVARWNGSAWSALATGVNASVRALRAYVPPSIGAPRLYVGGDFQMVGAAPANYLAAWSGTAWSTPWTPPSYHPSNSVRALGVHDDGNGARLYVGCSTLYPDAAVLRTDGVSMSVIASGPGVLPVYALATYHTAGAPKLAAVGLPSTMWTGVSSWDGARWNVLTDSNGVFDVRWPSFSYPYKSGVYAIAEVDVGDGPQFFAGGSFTQAGGVLGGNIARWDGTRWQPMGGGIEWPGSTVSGVYALLGFDEGAGTALYAGGLFTQAGGATAYDLARWNGTNWSALGNGFDDEVRALVAHDDGTGAELYAGGRFRYEGSQLVNRIARWNGTSWSPLGVGMSGPVFALASFDDGSGSALYAGGLFQLAGGQPANAIARWNGTSWSPVGGGMTGPGASVFGLLVHDDGSGPALYATGPFSSAGGAPSANLARWNGTSWSAVGGGLDSYAYALAAQDDGTGKALYAGGTFAHAGGVVASDLARWNGTSWSSVVGGVTVPTNASVFALASADEGGGTGPALFVGGSFTALGGVDAHWVGELHGCRIASFCAGDGLDPDVTTPCPCGNFGAQGRGCAWHAGPSGAALVAQGRIAPSDELVLVAAGMPLSAPSTIFLKGDQLLVGGAVFGDGVRCVGGGLIRLGTKTNVGGSARYPESGNTAISVRGATPVGSGLTGWYQTYYRNAASYCTSATFNVTNGVRVIW